MTSTTSPASKADLKPGENKVFYESDGETLAALVFIPRDYKPSELRPAIVLTRPGGGVKEQTAGKYARMLSEKGFVTVSFDPKGYGESTGRPRYEEPFSIVSDTRNTISYVESLNEVDSESIFNAGVCQGSAYAIVAGTEDPRIRGTAVVSPYLFAHLEYPKLMGGKFMASVFVKAINFVTRLLHIFGGNLYIKGSLNSWLSQRLPALPVQRGASEYYGPGKEAWENAPLYDNKINLAPIGEFVSGRFNSIDVGAKYDKPCFFMAYADGGYSPELMKKFFDDLKVQHKELYIAKDATHYALYYKPEFMNPIVDRIADVFWSHLGQLSNKRNEDDQTQSINQTELAALYDAAKAQLESMRRSRSASGITRPSSRELELITQIHDLANARMRL